MDSPLTIMSRQARDAAVHSAFETHREALRDQEITMRAVQEVCDLAVHNALVQYNAFMQSEIAMLESHYRMRHDLAMLKPPTSYVGDKP